MRFAHLWVGLALAFSGASLTHGISQTGTATGIVHVRNAHSAGAVVYLIPNLAEPLLPPPVPLLIDQRNLHFVPSVLPVLPGQTIVFRNSDPILHNVFSPDTLGESFDLGTYPEGEWRTHTFRHPGAHVILCHVHPEMEAYVVVVPTRHSAVADDRGHFHLDQVPPGAYVLHVWHSRARPFQQRVTIGSNDTLHLEIQLERRRPRGAPGR